MSDEHKVLQLNLAYQNISSDPITGIQLVLIKGITRELSLLMGNKKGISKIYLKCIHVQWELDELLINPLF
jgi:hypothetical protein